MRHEFRRTPEQRPYLDKRTPNSTHNSTVTYGRDAAGRVVTEGPSPSPFVNKYDGNPNRGQIEIQIGVRPAICDSVTLRFGSSNANTHSTLVKVLVFNAQHADAKGLQ